MAKVLFLITQSEIGGAQRFLLEFAPYLAGKGHEVIIAAGEGDGELFSQFRISNFEFRMHNIERLMRKLNPLQDVLALLKIKSLIDEERPDVLFLQSTKAGFLGAIAGKLVKIQNSKFKMRVV